MGAVTGVVALAPPEVWIAQSGLLSGLTIELLLRYQKKKVHVILAVITTYNYTTIIRFCFLSLLLSSKHTQINLSEAIGCSTYTFNSFGCTIMSSFI